MQAAATSLQELQQRESFFTQLEEHRREQEASLRSQVHELGLQRLSQRSKSDAERKELDEKISRLKTETAKTAAAASEAAEEAESARTQARNVSLFAVKKFTTRALQIPPRSEGLLKAFRKGRLLRVRALVSLQQEREFAAHMQRSELYVCFLGDALLCHPGTLEAEEKKQRDPEEQLLLLQRQGSQENGQEAEAREGDCSEQQPQGLCLLDLLWKIATSAESATKRVQSFALKALLKLLLLQLAGNRLQALEENPRLLRVVGARVACLLEVTFLQPALEHHFLEFSKFVRRRALSRGLWRLAWPAVWLRCPSMHALPDGACATVSASLSCRLCLPL